MTQRKEELEQKIRDLEKELKELEEKNERYSEKMIALFVKHNRLFLESLFNRPFEEIEDELSYTYDVDKKQIKINISLTFVDLNICFNEYEQRRLGKSNSAWIRHLKTEYNEFSEQIYASLYISWTEPRPFLDSVKKMQEEIREERRSNKE